MAVTPSKKGNMIFLFFSTLKLRPWVHFKVLLGFISKWVGVHFKGSHGSIESAPGFI